MSETHDRAMTSSTAPKTPDEGTRSEPSPTDPVGNGPCERRQLETVQAFAHSTDLTAALELEVVRDLVEV